MNWCICSVVICGGGCCLFWFSICFFFICWYIWLCVNMLWFVKRFVMVLWWLGRVIVVMIMVGCWCSWVWYCDWWWVWLVCC